LSNQNTYHKCEGLFYEELIVGIMVYDERIYTLTFTFLLRDVGIRKRTQY